MNTNEPQQRIKCTRCKVNLTLDKFKKKRDDTYQKRCNECNEKDRIRLLCEHGRRKTECKECGGVSLCKHGRIRSRCKECGGGQICEHGRIRSQCKECGGGQICEHGRRRSICTECGGGHICEHGKQRSRCTECGGGHICEHGKLRSRCIECGGSQICEHGKQKEFCIECGGGQICEHGRRRSICTECGGGHICEHGSKRSRCKVCNFGGHLKHVVSSRISNALKSNKELSSLEYLGAGINTIKEHIEAQFKEGMTWDNHGEWHIDHIVPVAYGFPTLEEQIERLHYKNLQPLWATDNLSKSNRFIG